MNLQKNGAFIVAKALMIESGQKPAEEQNSPVVFDEDCKELPPTMMQAFKSAVVQRNRKKAQIFI